MANDNELMKVVLVEPHESPKIIEIENSLEAEQAGYSASKAALDKVTIDLGYKVQGTDVMISLADPGWCQTDLGGPNAPNKPESAIPGILVGAFIDDKKSGRYFGAQEFAGMSIEEAVEKAQKKESPYK